MRNLILVLLCLFMKVINHLGNEYSGTLGKEVTASKWKGRNYLKKHFVPANPKSALQTVVRGYFSASVSAWHDFITAQKLAYDWFQRYRKLQISPFNAMVGSRVKILKLGGAYTAPPTTGLNVDDGADPIEGAKVEIRKTGQTTVYAYGFTIATGYIPWTLCTEDEDYDMIITKTGFEDYILNAQTAAQLCLLHHMTGL